LADKTDKKGKVLEVPKEVYMKDEGNGKCLLMLNPSDMQVGVRFGEKQWVMGD
jgi:hypothetical protein